MPIRSSATLIGLFGVLALALATVGLYGVMAYNVTQRTREIGIRRALGAKSSSVLQLVLRQGFLLTAIGLLLGTAVSRLVNPQVSILLLDVDPTDPWILIGVSMLMACSAALACLIPALRATRVAPVEALRFDA